NDISILKKYNEVSNILIPSYKDNLITDIQSINKIVDILGKEKVLLDCNYNLYDIENIKNKTNIINFSFANSIRIDKSPFNKIDEYKLNSLMKKIK
ncbi:MAG: hypothetical protein IJH34_17375, partial [Romboutsia sp.]|nr:hypothetical protein [Romboutsia sp.]